MTLYMMGYVRPVIQIVTITLPIHYCISSTTYIINNYNVNNSNKSYGILEIDKNNLQNYIDCADYF